MKQTGGARLCSLQQSSLLAPKKYSKTVQKRLFAKLFMLAVPTTTKELKQTNNPCAKTLRECLTLIASMVCKQKIAVVKQPDACLCCLFGDFVKHFQLHWSLVCSFLVVQKIQIRNFWLKKDPHLKMPAVETGELNVRIVCFVK